MYQKKIPTSNECGLQLFLAVMNGKWKISLVWCIYSGYRRPAEIHKAIPAASRRVLDAQLKELMAHGLIAKTTRSKRPLVVEYELTSLGETIIPAINTTAQWGEEHREELEKLMMN
jgi:DNA-binding HxlR family transcriptional regulator